MGLFYEKSPFNDKKSLLNGLNSCWFHEIIIRIASVVIRMTLHQYDPRMRNVINWGLLMIDEISLFLLIMNIYKKLSGQHHPASPCYNDYNSKSTPLIDRLID